MEGTAPPGLRIALVCVGRSGRVELKQKGKVANVLWMNVGTVAFEDVPTLLLVSADAEEAPPSAPVVAARAARVVPADLRLGLGPDAVETAVLSTQADDRARGLFRELVRLKMRERLYSFDRLGREAAPDGAPTRNVWTEFQLPASAPPGEYEIRMIGYRDGTGELLARATLTARRTGIVDVIAGMAERHALLYGILSVLAAIAAGAASGAVFAGAKKGH